MSRKQEPVVFNRAILENLSLHMKLQQEMSSPFRGALRKSAVSFDRIQRLKSRTILRPLKVKSVYKEPLQQNASHYDTSSTRYMKVFGTRE